MRFPKLLTPASPNGLQAIPINQKGLNFDNLAKIIASSAKPATGKTSDKKSDKEEPWKVTGLIGAEQAAYQAVKAEEATQAKLLSELGELAFSTPDYQKSLANKNYLISATAEHGRQNDYEQQQRARATMDEKQAGTLTDLYSLTQTGGKTFRTNQQLIDQQEFLPETSNAARKNKGLHWNITTETEKDANEEADKLFAPAESKMNWDETANVFSKNMNEFYGIMKTSESDGSNKLPMLAALEQAMIQSGFQTTKELTDENGEKFIPVDLNAAYQSPLGRGFLSSFTSQMTEKEWKDKYIDKNGDLRQREFSDDYGAFVLKRLQLMHEKRLQDQHKEDKSFNVSEGMTMAKAEENKIINEMTGPAYQLAANTYTSTGAISKEQAITSINGVANIISNNEFVDDALFQKVKSGQATDAEMTKFFSLNKTQEQQDQMMTSMPIVNLNQIAFNTKLINDAVNAGIYTITRDENGKEALIATPDTEANALKYLESKMNNKNASPEERELATRTYEGAKKMQSMTEFLMRTPTTTVNDIEVTQAIMREQQKFQQNLMQGTYKEGTPVSALTNDAFYIAGSPQRVNFNGVNGQIVNVNSNMSMLPAYAASNFRTLKIGNEYVSGYMDLNGKPELPAYNTGSDGQLKPLTSDMEEFKYQQKMMGSEGFGSNPDHIYLTGSRTTAGVHMRFNEEDFKKMQKQNQSRMQIMYPQIPETQLAPKLKQVKEKIGGTNVLGYNVKMVTGTPLITEQSKEAEKIAFKSLKNSDGSRALTDEQIELLDKINDVTTKQTAAASMWQANQDGGISGKKYPQTVKWQVTPWEKDPRFDPNNPNGNVKKRIKTDANGNQSVEYDLVLDKDMTPNLAGFAAQVNKEQRTAIIANTVSDAKQIRSSQTQKQANTVQTERQGVYQNPVQPNNAVSAFKK